MFQRLSKHLDFRQIIHRCASYFQLSSWCLDIPIKHCLPCLIFHLGVSLGVRACELFLCFVAIVRVRAIVLTSLFSLFYVTGECHRFLHSLRSKRFRRVWEQRKTEERGFRYFACAENGARAKNRTVGVGEGKKGTACGQTPGFWKLPFAGERGSWLAGLVEHFWHVSIKGLKEGEDTLVVYHLPKNSGNFGWDVNGKTVLVCPNGNFPK